MADPSLNVRSCDKLQRDLVDWADRGLPYLNVLEVLPVKDLCRLQLWLLSVCSAVNDHIDRKSKLVVEP